MSTYADATHARTRLTIRAALDSAPLAIVVVHEEVGHLYANREAKLLFATSGQDVAALSVKGLLGLLKPIGARPAPLEQDGGPSTLVYDSILTGDIRDAAYASGIPVEVTLSRQDGEQGRTVIAYIADIRQRKLLQQGYDRQTRRLASLHAVDLAITGSFDLRVTLDVILDHITTQLEVDAADVLLYDEVLHRLGFGACRGFRTDALRHTSLPLGMSYAGTAALERRIVLIASLPDDGAAFRSSPLLYQEGFVSYAGIPLVAKGKVKGVLELFHRSSVQTDQEWEDFAQALAQQAAIAIDNASLLEDLQRSNLELTRAYDTTLEGWSRALDLRDHETEGHSERVADLSVRLARAVGLQGEDLAHVRRGALLHDIGKMGVPDSILLKPGPLTDEEWQVMRRHPEYAYAVLSPIGYLRRAIEIPFYHHERWDGTGYPHGLRGEGIPLVARIFAVVDVWDALTSERPYRPAWGRERASNHLRQEAGAHFDPALVEEFVSILEKSA